MYAMPDELSDLPTLMNNLLGSAATFRGHPDGAGTARLLEAAAQALQQQVAETKARRHRLAHTRGGAPPPDPEAYALRPSRACTATPSPAPHPSPAAAKFAAAATVTGAAWACDRVSDPYPNHYDHRCSAGLRSRLRPWPRS